LNLIIILIRGKSANHPLKFNDFLLDLWVKVVNLFLNLDCPGKSSNDLVIPLYLSSPNLRPVQSPREIFHISLESPIALPFFILLRKGLSPFPAP
jgi:hypothetical protein